MRCFNFSLKPIFSSGISDDETQIFRPLTPDILTLTQNHLHLNDSASQDKSNEIQILWKSIGINVFSTLLGVRWMVKMGLDAAESTSLWLSSNKSTWPPQLWDAVDCLGREELNIALYRVGREELDVSDGKIYLKVLF